MCFSPSASFTASAVLCLMGALTLRRTSVPREYALASIPFIFAIQQGVEGLLWLALRNPPHMTYWLIHAYIVFAGMVWPVMVPLSLYLIEPEPRRKVLMMAVIAAGGVIAVYTFMLVMRHPVSASISDSCIIYSYPEPQPGSMLLLYVIAACAAFFLSSLASIMWLGFVNMAAFFLCYYLYRYDLTSVWCFFAALISGLIYVHFSQRAKCPQPIAAM